ncbi:RNA-directed DNA polymerase, eukaryota [Tanacetum coccineum]
MMLLTMYLEIQRNLAHLGANDMLKALYSKQAERELLQTVREFHTCKQEEASIDGSFRRSTRGGVEEQQFVQLQNLVDPCVLSSVSDRWVWSLGGDGLFRVKDVRNLLDDNFLPKSNNATRWVKFIPIKVNVFAWKVSMDRLPTRMNLLKRDVYVPDSFCPICKEAAEDSSHLFFSCELAVEVSRLVCRWWDMTWPHISSYEEWLSWLKDIRLDSNRKLLLEGVFYTAWWSIWRFRNCVLFEAKNPRKDVLFDDIVSRAYLWCHARCSSSKCVSIVIPNELPSPYGHTAIGFGVCPGTSDPTLVKIHVNRIKKPYAWVVEVFTLSTRVWKTLYMGEPFKSCNVMLDHVFVDGIIYWRNVGWDEEGLWSHNIISFDLKREKFDEVSLPEELHLQGFLVLAKVNESLRLLEYYNEGEIWVCGVWTKKDGVNKHFTKIYTVKVEGKSMFNSVLGWKSVLGFRNNGEVVLEMEDDNDKGYAVEVYKPSSGHINAVGINGKYGGFSVRSYTETLLLLHESNSIIN